MIDRKLSHLPVTEEAKEKFNRLFDEMVWEMAMERARAEIAAMTEQQQQQPEEPKPAA